MDGEVFPFYKNYICGLMLGCQCGCSFRNMTGLYIPFMLAQGGSTVRSEEIDWWRKTPDLRPPSSPLFQWCVFHCRHSAFQQVQLAPGNRTPVQTEQFHLTYEYEVTHPSQEDISLQIPVENSFPQCNGVWRFQQHIMWIYSESQGNGCFQQLLYLYSIIRGLRRSPQAGIQGNRPYSFISQKYQSLGQYFHIPIKVALLVNNLICCFNILFPLFTDHALCGL